MSHSATFTTMSGVHPTASVLPETSPEKTDPSQERKKPASPEKRERRRKQVLLAQRAYRARNEANTTALKQRITHLESALERMSKAVVDFSDILIQEQLLASHPHVADRLRETLKTCLDSAMYGDEHQEDFGHSQPTLAGQPDSASGMEAQVFVDNLRITCLYQGFLMLNNQSVPLEALRRPFRLFLSLVRRQTITSFFYACLHTRLNNRQPEMCKEIPFFKLGGAGTHYPRPVASQNKAESRGLDQQHVPIIHGDSSAFSPEAQEELGGEWFDLWDLAGYLRTEGITLSVAPPIEKSTYRTVNAVDFTAALVEKGIFLGHSPGFKRTDVETALGSSSWT